jgi:hypothetical protein
MAERLRCSVMSLPVLPFCEIVAMKRPALLACVVLMSLAACTDKHVDQANMTAPSHTRLTTASLPSDASTVCVAAVKERDQLLAPSTKTSESVQTRIDALDALVEDTCY